MAASPNLKVFNSKGQYIASCKCLEDAAALAGLNGKESKVKLGHNGIVLWHEGYEEITASDSYDRTAEIMASRIAKNS